MPITRSTVGNEAEPETTPEPSDEPTWEGSLSASEPIVAPDGHVVLSQEDIDARA